MDRRETTSGRIRGTRRDGDGMARVLRQHMTPAEAVLWRSLRERQLGALKFRRQHPLGPYIVDFCCPESRLIVEVDGKVHERQREYDAGRTEQFEHYGYRVLRFSNDDIMYQLDAVLDAILTAASEIDTRQPKP
ncbi:MAG TPA: DUF559 domain-containing protein [Thermomicrobiales bacterium]|nr:DUF559 domain-containing protein [Thermomicrobiales bacterium]